MNRQADLSRLASATDAEPKAVSQQEATVADLQGVAGGNTPAMAKRLKEVERLEAEADAAMSCATAESSGDGFRGCKTTGKPGEGPVTAERVRAAQAKLDLAQRRRAEYERDREALRRNPTESDKKALAAATSVAEAKQAQLTEAQAHQTRLANQALGAAELDKALWQLIREDPGVAFNWILLMLTITAVFAAPALADRVPVRQ